MAIKRRTEGRKGEESGWKEKKTKRQMGNGGTMYTAWRWGALNITVGRKLVKA